VLIYVKLSKEDEAAVPGGGEDIQVRREDQQKINQFSTLHQKEMAVEEALRGKLVCIAHMIRSGVNHGGFGGEEGKRGFGLWIEANLRYRRRRRTLRK
jgi:hypothetical protein